MAPPFKKEYKKYEEYGKDWAESTFKTHPNLFESGGSMEVDSTSNKRKADSTSGGSKAKQPANTPAQSVQTNASPDTPIGEQVMPNTGTGAGQASGGASSEGTAEYIIERPLTHFGTKISTYRKVHKLMTFGYAETFINGSDPINKFLTSYLAEIPWHIPAFYLNPSEYALMPKGSHCVGLEIEVYYRGSTIQFQTAASTSGLATLNQINDIAIAHGLNRTGWGSNCSYRSFGTGLTPPQPMIPMTVGPPMYDGVVGVYRGMLRDYYGANNNDPNYNSYIPRHQVGRQGFLYNYWITTGRSAAATAPALATDQFGGWPAIAEKIKQMDGKTVVNTCVAKSHYKPKMGMLTEPLTMLGHGLPFPNDGASMTVPVGGHLVTQRTAGINSTALPATPPAGTFNDGVQFNAGTETTQGLGNSDAIQTTAINIYTPIEKSQYSRSGFWGEQDPHIQPSIHVGVQPVPQLTSTATVIENGVFNSWTDTRAYWEVIATMHVNEHKPTAWPYAIEANVPAGEVINFAPQANWPAVNLNPINDGATFAGLYTNSSLTLP